MLGDNRPGRWSEGVSPGASTAAGPGPTQSSLGFPRNATESPSTTGLSDLLVTSTRTLFPTLLALADRSEPATAAGATLSPLSEMVFGFPPPPPVNVTSRSPPHGPPPTPTRKSDPPLTPTPNAHSPASAF